MGSLHDVQEMKRVQEMTRIDEFSRQQLSESPNTISELTSQIQELQDQVNFMKDSQRIAGGQSTSSSGSKSSWHRDQSPRPAFGVRLVHRETFLPIHLRPSTQCQDFLGILMLQVVTQCNRVQGDLQPEVKSKTETQYQCRDLQRDHQSGIFSFQRKGFIHRILCSINKDFRSRNFNLTNFPHLQLFLVGR